MTWTSIHDQLPPDHEQVFIFGLWKQGKEIGAYFAEAVFNQGKFDEPYYGQTEHSHFKNVTHWMKPEKPEL